MRIEKTRIDGLSIRHFIPERVSYPYPLLFIHGMWGGKWQWDNYVQFAYGSGFECYTVDLRGHHESIMSIFGLGNVSIRDHIQDLQKVIRKLDLVIIPIGHSMGGLIAQALATTEDVPCAVFIASAPPKGISVLTWDLIRRMSHPHYLQAMCRNKSFKPRWEDARELLYNCLDIAGAMNAYKDLMFDSGRVARELALGVIGIEHDIKCPTLVVSPREDCLINPRVQKKIAKRYNSDFLEIQGGHMVVTSEKGGNTAKAIFDWVRNTP